jgi:hypothetical protein
MMVAGLRIGVRASEGHLIWSALDDRDGPALSLLKITVAFADVFDRECFMNIVDLDLPSKRSICGGKEWKRIL